MHPFVDDETMVGVANCDHRVCVAHGDVPIKDGVEQIVQQATELGVTRIKLVTAKRSPPRLARLDRLRRVIVGACEQSGRAWLPDLHEVQPFESAVRETAEPARLIASLTPSPTSLATDPCDTSFAVGPEGGWTETEERFAERHDFERIHFGPLTLRATTAAVAGLTLIRANWGWRAPAV